MSAFSTFLRRLHRFDRRRSWQFVTQSAAVSRMPRWCVLIDMLWCALRYEATFENYCEWDFRVLSARERASYMTDLASFRLSRRVNDSEHTQTFDDKVRFAQRFGAELGREWLDVSTATDAEVEEFVGRFDRVFAKDPQGVGGTGISLQTADDREGAGSVREELLGSGQILLEEGLAQHPELARLHPESVNSLRMVSFLDAGGEVHLLAAVLKIGNGGVIDNFSNGGMYTMLDEQGRALHAAVDEHGRSYERHPVTGVIIPGYQVPQYAEVVAFVEHLARRVPQVPYVGWDIAITAEGPVVLEGNHNTGVFQSKPTVSGIRQGLAPLYRRVANV